MSNELETKPQWTPEQLELITNVVAKGATPDELKLFLYRCQNLGLDPLKPGQIYFIKYGSGPGTIVVGIEGFRARAGKTGKLSGIKRGAIRDADGKLIGAYAEVFRTDWKEPAREEVPLAEYTTGRGNWQKMPETMIKKVAEAAALRMAFPDDLGGVYTREEMDQAEPPHRVFADQPQQGDGVFVPPKITVATSGSHKNKDFHEIPIAELRAEHERLLAATGLNHEELQRLDRMGLYLQACEQIEPEPRIGPVALDNSDTGHTPPNQNAPAIKAAPPKPLPDYTSPPPGFMDSWGPPVGTTSNTQAQAIKKGGSGMHCEGCGKELLFSTKKQVFYCSNMSDRAVKHTYLLEGQAAEFRAKQEVK